MWINQVKLDGIKWRARKEGQKEGRERAQAALLPFPEFYQKRLAYWKERAGEELKPGPHRILVYSVDKTLVERFDSLATAKDRQAWFVNELNEGHALVVNGEVVGNKYVVRIDVDEGHPSPYTPAEIEVWAKEKVQEEMKGWRVTGPEHGPTLLTMTNATNGMRRYWAGMAQQMQNIYPLPWPLA